MSAEDDVRKASKQFYTALNRMANGDPASLQPIWSHNDSVTTMHPVGGREVGWDHVWNAWDQVAQVSSDGTVELKEQLIRVVGDLAYEVGVEHVDFKIAGNRVADEVRVTNIYRQEGGAWKIVHHHADLAPQMVEVLQRLQSGG
ncbi:MAG: nuclear transport factor 2 family protein [Candidatus Latescibacterota bacterium]|jgi:ketosteroid isomerase-like protein